MRVLTPMLLLAGCATVQADANAAADLARELDGRSAGPAVDCVDTNATQALDIVSADTLVLRAVGTVWVNRLPDTCPGLRPLDQLVIEPTMSGRYCRNDRFRALDPGSTIPGPTCRLGSFTPYRR